MRERSRIEIVDGASRSSRARTALEPRRERARDDGRARRIVARTRARPDPEFPRRDERSRRSNVVARRGAPFGTSRDADDRSRVATVALARARVRPESSPVTTTRFAARLGRSTASARARRARGRRTPRGVRLVEPPNRARRHRSVARGERGTRGRVPARRRDARGRGTASATTGRREPPRDVERCVFFVFASSRSSRARGFARRATTRGPNRRRRIVTSTRAERWPRASRDRRSRRSRATREDARRRARRAPRPRRRPRRRCPSSRGTSTGCGRCSKRRRARSMSSRDAPTPTCWCCKRRNSARMDAARWTARERRRSFCASTGRASTRRPPRARGIRARRCSSETAIGRR